MAYKKCNHVWDEPQCVYGCGTLIEVEHGGYCPVCKEHSNNTVECVNCGETAEVDNAGKVIEPK